MLHIYLGPMYSGKTSKLIEMFHLNNDASKITIDFDIGKENGCYEGVLQNHNNIQLHCIKTKCLKSYDVSYDVNVNSIYINEAQFFPDLFEFVLEKINKQKTIYLYGLDGDFQQNKMGSILDLIPYCDTICKLKSICNKCNNHNAIFSKRITNSKEQYLPDENAYIPLCRNCFYII